MTTERSDAARSSRGPEHRPVDTARWICRGRAQGMDAPANQTAKEDPAFKLKRLRRENEIPCQEREILKRAAPFALAGTRRLSNYAPHRSGIGRRA